MALASWSKRRILMLWAGGLLLQVLLIVAPVLIGLYLIDDSGELMRVEAQQQARWRAAELADSLSLAKQRAESRAAHTYTVTASGDTLFPLVHVPSGRPNPVNIAVGAEEAAAAPYLDVLLFGLIPTLLILVTLIWAIARRRGAGPPEPTGAS